MSIAPFRIDGRKAHERRPLYGKIRVLSGVDGSSCVVQGGTSVVVVVAGPKDLESRDVRTPVIEFKWCEQEGLYKNRRTADALNTLRTCFESVIIHSEIFNTRIEVNIKILSSDGDVFSCALNATSLALADAGVPMREMLCSMCVLTKSVRGRNIHLFDPTIVEEEKGDVKTTVAVLSRSHKIVHLQSDRGFNKEEYIGLVSLCKTASADACLELENILVQEYAKSSPNE